LTDAIPHAMDLEPLVLSLGIATAALVIAGVTGVALAALLAKERLPGRDVLDALVTAPMVLPPTVLGYYVLVALGRNGALGRAFEALTGSRIVFTRTGAVLAATIGALPIVVKSARAALEAVDVTLLRAARTLGAGPVRAFFTVRLPLAGRGIIAALMLAYARALGDFGVTLMVAGDIPGETQTAPLAIYDAIQAHRDADALGMVLVFTAFAVGTLYAVTRLTARRDA
jgi:molybdate transport system permease protein